MRRDRDDREQRGDDESERDESAPDDGWSLAGPTFYALAGLGLAAMLQVWKIDGRLYLEPRTRTVFRR